MLNRVGGEKIERAGRRHTRKGIVTNAMELVIWIGDRERDIFIVRYVSLYEIMRHVV